MASPFTNTNKYDHLSRTRIRMWLETSLHEDIDRLARKNRRSFTAQIQVMLRAALGHDEPHTRK